MSWDPENRKGEGKIRGQMKEQETVAQKLPLCGAVFPLSLDRMGNRSCKGGVFVREDCISDREGCLQMGSLDLFYCTVMITCW